MKPKARSVFEIVYVPIEGASAEAVAAFWVKPTLEFDATVHVDDDGTATVTFDIEKAPASLLFCIAYYALRAETGVPRAAP